MCSSRAKSNAGSTTTPSGPPTPQSQRALFIDLNTIAANHYDALGEEKTAALFSDYQHTKKSRCPPECRIRNRSLKQLKDCRSPMISRLLPPRPDKVIGPNVVN